MEVYKILVVGEPQTGKSQIITSFFNCEQLVDKMSKPTTFTKNVGGVGGGGGKDASMDFVFQIVNVRGRKVRVQLWDMAGSKDTASVFSPLFVRNAVGCIVVGRADDKNSISA
jgi:GTPase SAR1 family protein